MTSRLLQIAENKNTKNFRVHYSLFYSAVSIVVLQAKQTGSVLRSIYKSFTITSTRSQHGQHNSRFLHCPWESTFFCKYSAQTIICLCPVFVKLANRPLFLHQREGMAKKDIQIFHFSLTRSQFSYIFFHIMEGQVIARISVNQSLVFLERVVQLYHKKLNAKGKSPTK